jgi:hypothetical protein
MFGRSPRHDGCDMEVENRCVRIFYLSEKCMVKLKLFRETARHHPLSGELAIAPTTPFPPFLFGGSCALPSPVHIPGAFLAGRGASLTASFTSPFLQMFPHLCLPSQPSFPSHTTTCVHHSLSAILIWRELSYPLPGSYPGCVPSCEWLALAYRHLLPPAPQSFFAILPPRTPLHP